MQQFDIPVALFIFKRLKAVEIMKRIAEVKPKKLYILADQGRNDEEKAAAAECRRQVEAAITWDCEVVKDYAEENRGVYGNIGQGAIRVLRQEKWAIFLEDDNLPEVTFFSFCKEMLERYENDTRVLWVCGTNYLGDYVPKNGDSYVFTRHMLPCGWASWANKFEKFYDGDLTLTDDTTVMSRIESNYCNHDVFDQYRASWMRERCLMRDGKRPISWDYQMDFTIKAHNLWGICPCRNQIRNIGVDELSTHGGKSFSKIMTQRFCGMDSYPLRFPLQHPSTLLPDPVFEKAIGKIILYPFKQRSQLKLSRFLRRVLKVPYDSSIAAHIKKRFR